MDTTRPASTTTTDRPSRQLAPWQVLLLVAAPAVAIAARLLSTPWYQNDDDTPDNARFLADIAASTLRNDIGGVLAMASAIAFAAVAVLVGLMVRERLPRVGTTGTLLAVVGGFGLAQWADVLMFARQAATLDEHRSAWIEFFDQSNSSLQAGVNMVLLALGALGWIVLGVGLYRSRLVPRAAAVLTAIGGAAVMLTAPGPLVSFIAGSAVISLFGLGWVALVARQRHDA